jgi:hypothetical protein
MLLSLGPMVVEDVTTEDFVGVYSIKEDGIWWKVLHRKT